MAGIRLHAALPRHPKVGTVVDVLGVPRTAVVGHVDLSWLSASAYARDGHVPARRLGLMVRDAGRAGTASGVAAAMVATGWWDFAGDGWALHDWAENASHLATAWGVTWAPGSSTSWRPFSWTIWDWRRPASGSASLLWASSARCGSRSRRPAASCSAAAWARRPCSRS